MKGKHEPLLESLDNEDRHYETHTGGELMKFQKFNKVDIKILLIESCSGARPRDLEYIKNQIKRKEVYKRTSRETRIRK